MAARNDEMNVKEAVISIALMYVFWFGASYAYRAFGYYSNQAAPTAPAVPAVASATVTQEYLIPELNIPSPRLVAPVADVSSLEQPYMHRFLSINFLPQGKMLAIFVLVVSFILLLTLFRILRHRPNKSESRSIRGTSPQAPPSPADLDSSAPCADEAPKLPTSETAAELNVTPNGAGIDAGTPATSSSQYGPLDGGTIPRRSSSQERPPRVNDRASANVDDGVAAVTIPHKVQWSLLLQMVEASVPHVRRLVDALLDCPAADDGSITLTVDEIVESTTMTCYLCGPNKATFDRHRYIRFSVDRFGLINERAARQWAEPNTFLQHALEMHTAESHDYANNSCAKCWRDVGFMKAAFVTLPPTLMFELDRFDEMRGTNRNPGHLSFPINMSMSPYMVPGHSYAETTTYDLYAVVVNNGEREDVGECTCYVMTHDRCWYFCRAGHGRERVTEETVLQLNARMVFYKRRTPGWNISECSEPWDISDL